jgi:hypothetical protein
MSPFTKTIHQIGATCLLLAAITLRASAVEPEVELRCEFRPTRASTAAAEAARFHRANADLLRKEIADELAAQRHADEAEFRLTPASFPVATTAR